MSRVLFITTYNHGYNNKLYKASIILKTTTLNEKHDYNHGSESFCG